MSAVQLKLYNAYINNVFAVQGATRYAGAFLSFKQAVEALADNIGVVSSYAPPIIAKAPSDGFTDQMWVTHNVMGQEDKHGNVRSGIIMEVVAYVSDEDLQAAILNSVDAVAQEIIDDEQNS